MKLQFKEQAFQLRAVKAVVDVFAGQTLQTAKFTLEKTKDILRKSKNAETGLQSIAYEEAINESIGYRNRAISITEAQVLQNIQTVQRGNELIESTTIERPKGEKSSYNLTIEMETGTGKTYTYIRSMYELHKHYGWSKYSSLVYTNSTSVIDCNSCNNKKHKSIFYCGCVNQNTSDKPFRHKMGGC